MRPNVVNWQQWFSQYFCATLALGIGCQNAFGADQTGGFAPYPNKADMLVVVAHPDDESTFGGLLPYYAACQQRKVVFVCLTSGEWGNGLPHHTKPTDEPDYSYDDSDYPRFHKVPADALYPCYYREEEMARALMMFGVKYQPLMPRFKDMSSLQPWGNPEPAFKFWGGREKVVEYLVRQIRRFQPDVVVSLAANGFNGNPQHAAASHGTVLACKVAADSRQYADQLDELKVWQPKKVYLHVADDEKYKTVHEHGWELECEGRPGSARIIAARGNALHESQEMKEECAASSKFVLVQTAVGPDVIGRDNLFENIDESASKCRAGRCASRRWQQFYTLPTEAQRERRELSTEAFKLRDSHSSLYQIREQELDVLLLFASLIMQSPVRSHDSTREAAQFRKPAAHL